MSGEDLLLTEEAQSRVKMQQCNPPSAELQDGLKN